MESTPVELAISTGVIVGSKTKTNRGTEYFSFTGIPYAQIPDGDRKFKDPIPISQWSGKYQCKEVNPCPQFDASGGKVIGDVDCLQLNVFTRKINTEDGTPSSRLPVLFYIHGGAYMTNSSNTNKYGPVYLMEKDIVLVTINYRVGALGFLSFEDPSVGIPGNAGLRDQLLALRWVQENIHRFGGNPGNVTACGGSAGACSVHLHLLSPRSKGLFHKAIIQSGSSLNTWSIVKTRTLDLARAVGWDGNGGDKSALECLQDADIKALILAQEKLITMEDRKNYEFYPFGPTIEPYNSPQCFISKNPLDMIHGGEYWASNMPLIAGLNSEEGLLLKKVMPLILSLRDVFENLIPHEIKTGKDTKTIQEMGKKIKGFYYKNETPSVDNLHTFTDLMTDRCFAHGIMRSIRHHRGPKRVYKFSVDSPTNNLHRLKFCGEGESGTSHGDEVEYMFHNENSREYADDTMERKTINLMTDLIAKFTSHEKNPSQWSTTWPEWSEDQEFVLHISNKGSNIVYGLEKERMKFWDELYKSSSCKL